MLGRSNLILSINKIFCKCLIINLSIFISIYHILSLDFFIVLSVNLFIYFYQFIFLLSIYLSIIIFNNALIHKPIYQFINLLIYLYIYLMKAMCMQNLTNNLSISLNNLKQIYIFDSDLVWRMQ